MAEETVPVSLTILDKEIRVACQEGEQEALRAAAGLLNDRMQAVRDSGKVFGADRIAVMAALNLTHELLQQRDEFEDENEAVSRRLQAMRDRIEDSMQNLQQIEF